MIECHCGGKNQVWKGLDKSDPAPFARSTGRERARSPLLGRHLLWSACDAAFQFCEVKGHFWKDDKLCLFERSGCNVYIVVDTMMGMDGGKEDFITFP